MNEQQRAELERIRDVLYPATGLEDYDEEIIGNALKSIKALLAQDALDKKADNARELGLSYDTPLSSFVRSSDEAKAAVMERVIDKATEEQKAVIGCVNHDCDKCKAVQEPVAVVSGYYGGQCVVLPTNPARLFNSGTAFYTAPPAAQKPWVGLTDEERDELYAAHHDSCGYPITATGYEKAIEAKLKEKNT
jgi:hypothetical protein